MSGIRVDENITTEQCPTADALRLYWLTEGWGDQLANETEVGRSGRVARLVVSDEVFATEAEARVAVDLGDRDVAHAVRFVVDGVDHVDVSELTARLDELQDAVNDLVAAEFERLRGHALAECSGCGSRLSTRMTVPEEFVNNGQHVVRQPSYTLLKRFNLAVDDLEPRECIPTYVKALRCPICGGSTQGSEFTTRFEALVADLRGALENYYDRRTAGTQTVMWKIVGSFH